MTQKYCDKCGKEIKIDSICNSIIPSYKIQKMDAWGLLMNIDLCDDCEVALNKWLSTKDGDAV